MKKKFDAVQFQREAREKLGKEYLRDRKAFVARLQGKSQRQRKAGGSTG